MRKDYAYPPELSEYQLFRLGYDRDAQGRLPGNWKRDMLKAHAIVTMNERQLLARSIAVELAQILSGRMM